MRVINVTPEMSVLPLGRLGENEVTQFVFDVSDWLEEYPGGTIGLANSLPHARNGYACSIESEGDGKYSWTITSAELTTEGKGRCELILIKDSKVKKGKVYKTLVGEALDPDADPPEAWQGYVTKVMDCAAAVLAAAHGQQIRFSINDSGHLVFSYSEDEEVTEETEWTDVDLGPVNAYAMAVLGGYSGTAAQFEKYMADIANGAASASASATSAAASAAEALEHTQSVIETWLGNNITPGSQYALDRTLALTNAAAPADMVGNLKNEFDYETYDRFIPQIQYWGENKDTDTYYGLTISRKGNRLIVNGTATDNVRIRLSSSYQRTNGASAVNNWPVTIPLIEGNKYNLRSKVVSGTIEGTISVALRDSTNSSVDSFNIAKISEKECTWTSGNGKIFIFISTGCVLTNAVIETDLVNVGATSVLDTVEKTNKIYSDLYPEIEYWGANDYSTDGNINCIRTGHTFFLTGTAGSDATYRYKLSAGLVFASGGSAVNNYVKSIEMEEGEHYVLSMRKISGSVTTGNFYAKIRNESNTDIATITLDKKEEFEWNNSEKACIYVQMTQGGEYSNLVVEVLLNKVDDQYIPTTVKELQKKVEELGQPTTVPEYYKEHIEAKALAFAMDDASPVGNSVKFAFITDTHLRNANGALINSCNSPALLKYLINNANLGMIVFGGDSITGSYETQAAAVKDLMFFREVFEGVWDKMFSIFGNHDYGNNSSSIEHLSYQTIYGLLERDKEIQYVDTNPSYGSYVIDDKAEKCRFLFTNLNEGSNLSQQKSFFCKVLYDTPAGWTIVVFTHFSLGRSEGQFFISDKLAQTNGIVEVIEAYMNRSSSYGGYDFSQCAGTVACIIGGHCHFDGMARTTSGIPVISTTCDKWDTSSDGYDRTRGTIGEQAFDLYTINTDTKTIDIIRVGAGENRQYTYGTT